MPKPLTQRQQEIYLTILCYIELHGFPPTVRDLCHMTGILAPNGVVCHLSALCKKGWITRDHTTARGIRPVGAKLTLTFDDTETGRAARALVKEPRTCHA